MMTIESHGVIPLKWEDGDWQVLLILHKQGSHWGFPKGRADGEELSMQAATRELKEETGLDITEFLSDQPIIEHYYFYKSQERVLKVVNYFIAMVSGELKLQEAEIRDAKWLPLSSAAGQLTFKEAKAICQKVIHFLERFQEK